MPQQDQALYDQLRARMPLSQQRSIRSNIDIVEFFIRQIRNCFEV